MNPDTFANRRQAATKRLDGAVLVVFAARPVIRNNDVHHSFRQDSDFYYLTGLQDPDAVMVLTASPAPKFVLFITEQDPRLIAWDGAHVTIDQAKERYRADEAYPMSQLEAKLGELLRGHDRAYFSLGKDEADDRTFIKAVKRSRSLSRRSGRAPSSIHDIEDVVHELRRIKEPGELDLMRQANAISQRGHLRAMALAAPGRFEFELQAALENEFLHAGSPRCAYPSIVGSGPNATTLHYVKNTKRLEDGELVLIDAGCEFGYYAADITRTFPVNGKFTEAQRRIYEIVLQAQLEAIAATRPGANFSDLHSVALRVIVQGLIDLGFIAGPVEDAIEDKRHQPFFMHKTGHYLGMDVHDVGAYRTEEAPRPFEPGVVITVEPGIYVDANNRDVPAEYRGIGIRIEDDVVVTKDGCENLTAGLAKTVDEIERACAG